MKVVPPNFAFVLAVIVVVLIASHDVMVGFAE